MKFWGKRVGVDGGEGEVERYPVITCKPSGLGGIEFKKTMEKDKKQR